MRRGVAREGPSSLWPPKRPGIGRPMAWCLQITTGAPGHHGLLNPVTCADASTLAAAHRISVADVPTTSSPARSTTVKDMKEETLNLSKQRALQLWCDMLLVLLNIVILLVLLMACEARVGSGFEPRANSSTTSCSARSSSR